MNSLPIQETPFAPKKSNKIWIIGVILLLILCCLCVILTSILVVGGGGAGYYFMQQKSDSGIEEEFENPTSIIPTPVKNIEEEPAEPPEPLEEAPQDVPEPELGVGSTIVSEEDGMTLLYVPEGEFEMGSNDNDDEKPVHTVWLDAFWIDQTEVTNAMYEQCVETGDCEGMASYPEKSNHPVVGVDWNSAETYCAWAGRRLPSEAEWEKAARGTDGRTYPWGNAAPSCSMLNYFPDDGVNCGSDTSEVGSYPDDASPYGALDMAGNVSEWVADWYGSTYYSSSPDSNPTGPDSGEMRVQRGGAYNRNLGVYAANRDGFFPDNWDSGIGFRCAASSQ